MGALSEAHSAGGGDDGAAMGCTLDTCDAPPFCNYDICNRCGLSLETMAGDSEHTPLLVVEFGTDRMSYGGSGGGLEVRAGPISHDPARFGGFGTCLVDRLGSRNYGRVPACDKGRKRRRWGRRVTKRHCAGEWRGRERMAVMCGLGALALAEGPFIM